MDKTSLNIDKSKEHFVNKLSLIILNLIMSMSITAQAAKIAQSRWKQYCECDIYIPIHVDHLDIVKKSIFQVVLERLVSRVDAKN
jgi:thioesterase domain-containing protein